MPLRRVGAAGCGGCHGSPRKREEGVFLRGDGRCRAVVITSTPKRNTKSSVETKSVRKLLGVSISAIDKKGATEWRSSYEFLTVRRPSLLTPSKSSVSRSGGIVSECLKDRHVVES